MSETTRHSIRITTYEEKAEELAREIKRTGIVRIDKEVYHVNEVSVFRNRGIVSGWNIDIDGDPKTYTYTLRDREDMTYMTIYMTKPGVVLTVGYHPRDGSRAVIIYRDE